MGAKLDNVDPELLKNLDLMLNYETLSDERDWKVLEETPDTVFKIKEDVNIEEDETEKDEERNE